MPTLASLKRLSISSAKFQTSKANSSAPVNSPTGLTSPSDVTSPTDALSPLSARSPTWALSPVADGGYAEMLDDDNMSWSAKKPSTPGSKKRLSLAFF